MKIAFDAKRAYQNGTGLGHYSRTLISSLASYFAANEYYLCAPKVTSRFDVLPYKNISNITPHGLLSRRLTAIWRSKWMIRDLKVLKMDIYHGLSHEIPIGIRSSGVKTVVTIHDLIFERYPKMYNWIDVQIYRKKFTYACRNSDLVIAISEQTREDLITFYNIPKEKIVVCYQSCNPAFGEAVGDIEKQHVRKTYNLPEQFFLYVGSIIERKNLLNICKALNLLKGTTAIPLVVIGDGGAYKEEVKKYLSKVGMDKDVVFLSDRPEVKDLKAFKSAADFPAIYQLSSGIIYPSVFEGFGLPVLEALWSKVPVITSNISCLPETGGDAAYYVDPYSAEDIAKAMISITTNQALSAERIQKGWLHAQNFTPEKCASHVMEVYLRLQ